ncbi:MAG: YdeI/OmpD-associated family protein [Bacteroidota bacterium]
MEATFNAVVSKFDDSIWGFHIKVPDQIYSAFAKEKIKRVLMHFDGSNPLHAGFMPEGDGKYFLMLSKDVMKKMQLALGQNVEVKIVKDTSKYGMPISEEMQELLELDPDGEELFHKLTPGKIRSLLHFVNKYKSSDTRIEKSVIILEHLKANNGKLDWKMLHEAFKRGPMI